MLPKWPGTSELSVSFSLVLRFQACAAASSLYNTHTCEAITLPAKPHSQPFLKSLMESSRTWWIREIVYLMLYYVWDKTPNSLIFWSWLPLEPKQSELTIVQFYLTSCDQRLLCAISLAPTEFPVSHLKAHLPKGCNRQTLSKTIGRSTLVKYCCHNSLIPCVIICPLKYHLCLAIGLSLISVLMKFPIMFAIIWVK